MLQALDSGTLGYVVVAFVPNLLIILWAMARMHRDIRVIGAKLGIVESDNRMLDEGLKALAHEIRELRQQGAPQDPAQPRAVANG
jgi:hypothetical protein